MSCKQRKYRFYLNINLFKNINTMYDEILKQISKRKPPKVFRIPIRFMVYLGIMRFKINSIAAAYCPNCQGTLTRKTASLLFENMSKISHLSSTSPLRQQSDSRSVFVYFSRA